MNCMLSHLLRNVSNSNASCDIVYVWILSLSLSCHWLITLLCSPVLCSALNSHAYSYTIVSISQSKVLHIVLCFSKCYFSDYCIWFSD